MMKTIITISSFVMGAILIDTKMSFLSACTADQEATYQNCMTGCNSAGPGTIGCLWGCDIYGWWYGCLSGSEEFEGSKAELVFGSQEQANKFRKYLEDKFSKLPKDKQYTGKDFLNFYKEFKNSSKK